MCAGERQEAGTGVTYGQGLYTSDRVKADSLREERNKAMSYDLMVFVARIDP